MATLVSKPQLIESAGNKPKLIYEFIGRVNTHDEAVSIARMVSPVDGLSPAKLRSSTSTRWS